MCEGTCRSRPGAAARRFQIVPGPGPTVLERVVIETQDQVRELRRAVDELAATVERLGRGGGCVTFFDPTSRETVGPVLTGQHFGNEIARLKERIERLEGRRS